MRWRAWSTQRIWAPIGIAFAVGGLVAQCGSGDAGSDDAGGGDARSADARSSDTGTGTCPVQNPVDAGFIFPGEPCSNEGLLCPYPGTGGCAVWRCDGTQFVTHFLAGPGNSCNQPDLECMDPGTECDTCTCDGTTFQCQENCCVCIDAGMVADAASDGDAIANDAADDGD